MMNIDSMDVEMTGRYAVYEKCVVGSMNATTWTLLRGARRGRIVLVGRTVGWTVAPTGVGRIGRVET